MVGLTSLEAAVLQEHCNQMGTEDAAALKIQISRLLRKGGAAPHRRRISRLSHLGGDAFRNVAPWTGCPVPFDEGYE